MANTPGTTKINPGQGGQQGQQGQQGRGDEGLLGKARETASAVMDKAKDAASSAARGAGELASAAGERAESATSSVGGGMKSLAGTLRENLPREGMLGTAGRGVADSLESGGRYLEQEGLGGMVDDLSALIRRNPLPSLLVGIGLGFLLARMTRS